MLQRARTTPCRSPCPGQGRWRPVGGGHPVPPAGPLRRQARWSLPRLRSHGGPIGFLLPPEIGDRLIITTKSGHGSGKEHKNSMATISQPTYHAIARLDDQQRGRLASCRTQPCAPLRRPSAAASTATSAASATPAP